VHRDPHSFHVATRAPVVWGSIIRCIAKLAPCLSRLVVFKRAGRAHYASRNGRVVSVVTTITMSWMDDVGVVANGQAAVGVKDLLDALVWLAPLG
jgi:hypothetical protein